MYIGNSVHNFPSSKNKTGMPPIFWGFFIIYIDLSEIPGQCTSYFQYIERIQNGINKDLSEAYPKFDIHICDATWDIMTNISQKTGQHFLFILDDRDALFHMSFCTPKDQDAYLLFLKSLLKDKVYAELTLALLFTKEAIPADIQEYAAVSMQLYTKAHPSALTAVRWLMKP